MRIPIEPFGTSTADKMWLGGRDGSYGSYDWDCDQWYAAWPPSWTFTRYVYPHIWCELKLKRRSKRSRVTATLTWHWWSRYTYQFARRGGFQSPLAGMRWATRAFHEDVRRNNHLYPYGVYNAVDTDHVYRRDPKTGEWEPFASVFRKTGSAWDVASGYANCFISPVHRWPCDDYAIVDCAGCVSSMKIGSWGMVGGGFDDGDALDLRRWTKTSRTPSLLPQVAA